MTKVQIAARAHFLWLIFDHADGKYKDMYATEFSTGLCTESVDKRVWQYCC